MTLETLKNKNKRRRKNWRYARDNRCYDNGRELRLLERIFFHYKDIQKEVELVRAEMGYYQSHKSDGGASSNRAFVSDPTASTALKRIGDIHKIIINSGRLDEDTIVEPEKWMVVVEQTMFHSKQEPLIYEVLSRRFMRNEPMPTTCIDLEISKDRYYRLRDTGLYYAKECAIQLGLIRVFEEANIAPF